MANWTWYPSGGDWTYIDSVCKIYEANGHQIIPFSVHNKKNFPTPYEKYFIDSIDYRKFYNKISFKAGIKTAINSIYSYEAKQKLKLLLNENKVDIAQLNNISGYQTPSIIPVLKDAKIPIVWRVLDYRLICPNSTFLSHDKICEACSKSRYYNCILKKCKKNSLLASTLLAIENYVYSLIPVYKHVDQFSFQSEFTRDKFVQFGFDINKTHIIENPFDSSKDQPEYSSKNYILYFGRISKEKGIFTLLNAMKSLPNIELKIVGDGPEYQDYLDFVKQNALQNISFLGPKWGNELNPIIAGCKMVIVPSIWNEPSGYVVLQAFSYGKPVIASKVGGLQDLITDNETGLFFEMGNAAELASKISSLFNDNKRVHEMGLKGRIYVEGQHNPNRYYHESMKVFTSLINSRS